MVESVKKSDENINRSRSLQISDATSNGNSSILLTRDSGVDTDGDGGIKIVKKEEEKEEKLSEDKIVEEITKKSLPTQSTPKKGSKGSKKEVVKTPKTPKVKTESLAAQEVQKALEIQKLKSNNNQTSSPNAKADVSSNKAKKEVVDEWAVVEKKKDKKNKGKNKNNGKKGDGQKGGLKVQLVMIREC